MNECRRTPSSTRPGIARRPSSNGWSSVAPVTHGKTTTVGSSDPSRTSTAWQLASLGASATTSRNARSTFPTGPRYVSFPPITVCTGSSRNSRWIATPKLPPPPLSAHEQLGVFVVARAHEVSVGRDQVRPDDVVGRQTVLRRQVADASSEREAAYAGRPDDAARRHEALRHRRSVEVQPRRATFGACDPCVPGRRARAACARGRSPGRRRARSAPPGCGPRRERRLRARWRARSRRRSRRRRVRGSARSLRAADRRRR